MNWERAAGRIETFGRFTTGFEGDGLKVYDASYELQAFAPFDYLEFRKRKNRSAQFILRATGSAESVEVILGDYSSVAFRDRLKEQHLQLTNYGVFECSLFSCEPRLNLTSAKISVVGDRGQAAIALALIHLSLFRLSWSLMSSYSQ